MSNVHRRSSKLRLDQALVIRGLVLTRSQAESYIKLGYVKIDGKKVDKPGQQVGESNKVTLTIEQQYVSRAALKLASVVDRLNLDFRGKIVLDVGSSTGGFTDYALRHGAKKVIAVDVGSDQMHPSLRDDPRVELHEQLDVRRLTLDARIAAQDSSIYLLSSNIDIVVIDVSFVSLRDILPAVQKLCGKNTQIVAMVKPQFEAGAERINKGVIKNDSQRRQILKEFEQWAKDRFVVLAKADSRVAGAHGNLERFYLLKVGPKGNF